MSTRSAFLVLFGAVLCQPAVAQQTGSRVPGGSGASLNSVGYADDGPISARPNDEAVLIMRQMAKCLVSQKRQQVGEYLLATTKPARDAGYKRFSNIMSQCLTYAQAGAAAIRFGSSSMSSALAEALVMRQAVQPPVAREPSTTETPYWISGQPDQRVVQEMAVCLADRYPAEVLALVRSNPGSQAEVASFSTLVPNMGPCLVGGTTLRANRVGIRFAMASAIYHRLNDPAVTLAEKK